MAEPKTYGDPNVDYVAAMMDGMEAVAASGRAAPRAVTVVKMPPMQSPYNRALSKRERTEFEQSLPMLRLERSRHRREAMAMRRTERRAARRGRRKAIAYRRYVELLVAAGERSGQPFIVGDLGWGGVHRTIGIPTGWDR